MIPKCTSWLGHKFEPRYSKSAAKPSSDRVEGGPSVLIAHFEAQRDVIYERDICVRCGETVEMPIVNVDGGSCRAAADDSLTQS